MPSAESTAVIQDIKYNVDQPHLCGWLDRLGSSQSKRIRAERYVDGAVKIVDLLREELPLVDIRNYQRRYQHFISLPENRVDERLHCAKDMWDFVVAIDELLSVSRISSAYDQRSEWDSDSDTRSSTSSSHSPKSRKSPQRHSHFVNTPEVRTASVPATAHDWWWPTWDSWYGNSATTAAWVPSIVASPQAGWCMSYAPVTCVASDRWPHILW